MDGALRTRASIASTLLRKAEATNGNLVVHVMARSVGNRGNSTIASNE
jgi:hypothetical protein